MKKIIFIAAVLAASATAYAQVLGMLVNTEMGTSVTGQLIYKCTYNVGGSLQTVILSQICPPSMNFR